MRKRLRKILPWAVATALLGYMLYTIPMEALLTALEQANVWCLLATVFFVDVGCLVTDSWATALVVTWFLAPVKFREMVPVRAASYLVAILNYNLGQAGLVYYFHRVKGAPLASATSMVLMMMGTIILLLGVMSVGGLALTSDERTRTFGIPVAMICVGAVFYFILLKIRPGFLANRALFRPLFDAGVSGHLKATLVRIPHLIVIIASHLFGMRCFGIEAPLSAGLVFIPMVLLVASLPLTPFGLGTMQMTAIHFFAPFARATTLEARKAMVFAYSLGLATLALGLQAVMGLVFLERVSAMGIFERDGEDGES